MSHEDSVTNSRPELLKQLRDLRIEKVTAEYNGSDDDGQIDIPEFGAAEVPDALVEAVQYLLYELLEQFYSGWENNEGGFGEFVWNVGNDSINLVHNTRQEAYETEERSL